MGGLLRESMQTKSSENSSATTRTARHTTHITKSAGSTPHTTTKQHTPHNTAKTASNTTSSSTKQQAIQQHSTIANGIIASHDVCADNTRANPVNAIKLSSTGKTAARTADINSGKTAFSNTSKTGNATNAPARQPAIQNSNPSKTATQLGQNSRQQPRQIEGYPPFEGLPADSKTHHRWAAYKHCNQTNCIFSNSEN
jgi:hypothetical protein